ncbi:MAG: AbgT family transporter [Sedimentibacter saalensis]|uniref:AbgT family transporter n=1 Tax=Sedimentibacter saalensis TaxID=130788 RepID=UPI002B21A436|nr:AbgT family transporter [Sedimentibacter saalensis]MEA5095647.1 AbgT family transporter [Sedimentibacter saalensis]
MAQAKLKKSKFDKFLDKIEEIGNKLPEAFMIFLYLGVFMMVLSLVASLFKMSAVHPVTGETLVVQNLISVFGLTKILTSAVSGFTGFAPLGVVLVCMLGVGLCEKSGLLQIAIKHGLGNVKGSPIKIIVILIMLSILSMAAGDSGFIVMPPLGALIFLSIGRNPLAGMMLAYASVAGAFGGNFIPTSLDMLLIGFTENAVQISGLPAETNPMMNYYFQLASTVLVTGVGVWVTLKFVEPRLGKLENVQVEGRIEEVTDIQRKGMKAAGISLLVLLALVVAGTAPSHGILRDPETFKIISSKAPLMQGLVVLITLAFFIPGMVFGRITGTIKDSRAMVKALNQSMSEMGGYIALTFMMALFSNIFAWSNMGIVLAIKGANALQASGFPIPVVMILLILFIIPLDVFLASSSGKWAIFAPIFVPMFMFLGFHPAFTQMVYRIGDAVINVCTPLLAYYIMMLELGRKYDKNLGLGTMVATMLPYSIFYMVGWIALLLIWYFTKLPLGPGGPLLLP